MELTCWWENFTLAGQVENGRKEKVDVLFFCPNQGLINVLRFLWINRR